jgi:hypothetical protein
MTLVLFSWATRQDFFEGLTNRDVRIDLFNKDIEKIESEIIPFYVEDGFDPNGEWDGQDRWFDKNTDTTKYFGTSYWMY